MAFSEHYCDPVNGSNLNAGSTPGSPLASYASGSWVAATGVFTAPGGSNPSSDGVTVGMEASVMPDGTTGTTPFVGFITAVTSTTITVSLTRKSGTAPVDGTGNRTLKIGGAWKGPNAADGFPFGFMATAMTNSGGDPPRVNLKAGASYSITAAMTHGLVGPIAFQGYTTTVGDGGRATIDGGTSGASYTLLTVSGAANSFRDLVFQNNGASGAANGLAVTANANHFHRCVFSAMRQAGVNITAGGVTLVECEAYGNNLANTPTRSGIEFSTGSGGMAIRCISRNSNGNGFTAERSVSLIECIAVGNSGAGIYANLGAAGTFLVQNCDLYNNGSNGVTIPATFANAYIENCNLVKNGGYGIAVTGGAPMGLIRNCGFGSGTQANTSGQTSGLTNVEVSGSVTYATDVTPWVDPANGDFRISLAAAKGVGRGSFTQTQSGQAGAIGYPDIGAAQHQETTSGGGLMLPRPMNGGYSS